MRGEISLANDAFTNKLKLAGLNKTTLAQHLGISKRNVYAWGKQKGKNDKVVQIPCWVNSFLNLYIEHKRLKEQLGNIDFDNICKLAKECC